MLAGKTPYSGFVTGVIGGVIVALALAAIAYKAFFLRKPDANPQLFLIEGFDFRPFRNPANVWRGPNLGEKIDLTHLKVKDGKTLASAIGKRPIVLVVVNPECAMCRTASDEMRNLRERLGSVDIKYYVVAFESENPNIDFFRYGDSLSVGAPSFLWDKAAGAAPLSVLSMTVPSHLLVNSDGTVMCVWLGSSNEKFVRDRMASQIVTETLVVSNALDTLVPKTAAPIH
jgi:hypothetical protein